MKSRGENNKHSKMTGIIESYFDQAKQLERKYNNSKTIPKLNEDLFYQLNEEEPRPPTPNESSC